MVRGGAAQQASSQATNQHYKALGGGPTGGIPNRIWWLGGPFKRWSEAERPSKQAAMQPTNTIKLWGAGPTGGVPNRI